MSLKNFRTAGVALSSWKSNVTVDARGRFRSQAFPTLFQSAFIYTTQARHLTKKVVAQLSSTATTPLALVGLGRLRLLGQVSADFCVSREELGEPADDSLPLPLGALSYPAQSFEGSK